MPRPYSNSELLELWGCQRACPVGQEIRLEDLIGKLRRECQPRGRSPSEWAQINAAAEAELIRRLDTHAA